MTLREIAVHEAAHAVLAWATGSPILGLAMLSDSEYARLSVWPNLQTSWGRAYFPGVPASISKNRHCRLLADREAMVSLAGDLAVRLYRGTPLKKRPTNSDLDSIVHAADLAASAGEDVEAHLERLVSKTLLFLRVYWDRLLMLADELLRKRKLLGPEIKNLLRGR